MPVQAQPLLTLPPYPFRGDTMNVKDVILMRIRKRAVAEAEFLAGEFARAASGEREAILAGLEFEKWLAEACDEAAEDPL